MIIRPAGILTEWNELSRRNLVETSKGGAYERQAVSAAKRLASADNKVMSSGPERAYLR